MTNMKSPLEQFIDAMENDPLNNKNPHPKLFTDLDNDQTSKYLFDLWQMGCVEAEYDEEKESTMWEMSDFGDEILEKGVDEIYFEMMENEETWSKTPAADAKRVLR